MEAVIGLEAQVSVIGRERNSFEGCDTGNSYLLYERLQTP